MRLVPLIAALAIILPAPLAAQQKPPPGPPKVAPAKAYKPLPVKLPAAFKDADFEAFRKQLGEVASKKDRAGLAKLVVAKDFFWEGEKGDQADKKKSGADNLATALGLAKPEVAGWHVGWEMLGGFASDPTASEFPPRKGAMCSPADPQFDDKGLEELAKSTQTDPGEWAFPVSDGVEVRSAAQPKAPVSEKLGLHLIRVLPPEGTPPASQGNEPPMVRIVPPSGKVGYVSADLLAPLGTDQICYIKEGADWKIVGFNGAGDP
jgi:hypothetical protein